MAIKNEDLLDGPLDLQAGSEPGEGMDGKREPRVAEFAAMGDAAAAPIDTPIKVGGGVTGTDPGPLV